MSPQISSNLHCAVQRIEELLITLLWLVTTWPDFPPALVALWCPHMSDLRACAPQCRSCRDAAGTTGLQRLGQASDTKISKMLAASWTQSHYSLDRNVSLTCAAPADWWFENTAVDTVLVEKQRPSHNLWCPNIGTFHGMPSWNSEFSSTYISKITADPSWLINYTWYCVPACSSMFQRTSCFQHGLWFHLWTSTARSYHNNDAPVFLTGTWLVSGELYI